MARIPSPWLGLATTLLLSASADAQTSSDPFGSCAAGSRAGAVLLVPDTPLLDVHAEPLQAGDKIAALAPDGTCVGQATWTGTGTALQVWADDPMTPVLDGLLDGDPIELAVWDLSTDAVYEGADVSPTYDEDLAPTDGFEADALFALAREGGPVEVDEPSAITLGDPYPNPATERATIPVRLDGAMDVTVEVFDALGRQVERVFEGHLGAGAHDVRVEAGGLPSGVYLVRVRTDTDAVQGQFIVAR